MNRKMKKCAYTEYAVEVNGDKGFIRQIDVFKSYEEAEAFAKNYDEEQLNDDEYLNIIFIDYDKYGDEIDFGSVV